MDEPEHDIPSGQQTTGHEWNGIKELDSPIPKVVLFFLAVTIIFSVIYWVLAPAWPLGVSYTRGILGLNDRAEVTAQVETAAAARAGFTDRLATESFASLAADPELMAYVDEVAPTLFGDNCAACHGVDRQGGPGFPNLSASARLWGADPETIAETIRVGINGTAKDTRTGQMMAFGRDGILQREQVLAVASYVRSLSGQKLDAAEQARVPAGKEVYAANCVACHGADAKGQHDLGAPDLTDASWIYGGDLQSVVNSIHGGRQGQMPSWEGRLSTSPSSSVT